MIAGSWRRRSCRTGSTLDSSPCSDRGGLAADLSALPLANSGAVEHRHVARPVVPGLAAGQAEEVGLAAHEQIEPVARDVTARVIGDHAAIVDVAAPGLPARHRAALEQRHIE